MIFRAPGLIPLLAFLLAGCSSEQYFDTKGLRAPVVMCSVKPSDLGSAERIRDVDEGNGCEIENAWRINSIANVQFSQPATVNCGLAEPLNDWITNTVQPAAQNQFSERIVGVDVAASYSCRPRNNARGAKMSEHGYGNAIDISAFTLESGRKVKVAGGWWGSRGEKAFLRQVRGEACGRFSTVLGPGSDRYHSDHFHLDLQNRRSGQAYCH